MKLKHLFWFEVHKFVIAFLNLFLLVKNYQAISVAISLVCIFTSVSIWMVLIMGLIKKANVAIIIGTTVGFGLAILPEIVGRIKPEVAIAGALAWIGALMGAIALLTITVKIFEMEE